MSNLAATYHFVGRLDKALPLFEQTLERMKAKLGLEHPDTLATMNNLAVTYRDSGDVNNALRMFEQSLELKLAIGPEHPDTFTTMNNLAVVHQSAGDSAKALPLFEQALERSRAMLGPGHPVTLDRILNLVRVYQEKEDYVRALEVLQAGFETDRLRFASQPADRRTRAALLLARADTLNQLMRWEEAEADAREAVSIRQELMADEWGYFNALSHLGASLLGQGKHAEAEPVLVDGYRGLDERDSQIPAMHRLRVLKEAASRLVKLYEAWDKPDEAAIWTTVLRKHSGQ